MERPAPLDPQTLTRWYSEHNHRLKAFVFGVVRDWAVAEEVVQAAFVKAATHGAFVKPGCERSWLFQVAFNEAKLIQRRRGVEAKAVARLDVSESSEEPAEHSILRWEMVEQVREALHDLPPEQRDVVMKRIYEEQTFQEIADAGNIPLGTVLTRMRLALQKLQKKLKSNTP